MRLVPAGASSPAVVAAGMVGLWLTVAGAVPAARQSREPQATYSSRVDVVALYATVVGGNDRLVRDLTAGDFELKVDGQAEPITVFQAGQLPITVAILLDDSPSMGRSMPKVVAAGRAFLARLGAADRATVGRFSRTVTMSGELTDDRQELAARLAHERPAMAGTALWDALNAGLAVLDNEPGRRVIVVISDGDDNISETTASEAAQRAIRAGAMIYAVGVRSGEGRLGASLRDMARDSGGAYFALGRSDNLDQVCQRVADELHTQYLIGFAPAVRDGRPHRVELKVRRPGCTVRFRRTFVAGAQ